MNLEYPRIRFNAAKCLSLINRDNSTAVYALVEQLQKDTEMDMFSFSKVIARVLIIFEHPIYMCYVFQPTSLSGENGFHIIRK